MSMLDTIFAAKMRDLPELRASHPLPELKARIADQEPPRGFRAALQKSFRKPALIAEVKKASPVAGDLRSDFDPSAIAKGYAEAGVQCISVLTDVEFFKGSPEYLPLCRSLSGLPVLRKDFTADEHHVWEARALGADAILLIAAMLSDNEMRVYQDLAWSLGMDVLVEVHSQDEAERAASMNANLIGVNNRDLETFRISIESTERIMPWLKENAPGAVLVSESALHERADVRRAEAAGADAVLIGTAFSKAPDMKAKIQEMMGW